MTQKPEPLCDATASRPMRGISSMSVASAHTKTYFAWSRPSRAAHGKTMRFSCLSVTSTMSSTPMFLRFERPSQQHGLHDRVILTGFVPDNDLVYLYSRATALVLPSLMEGFGLPAVEAMACGTPVISSRAGSLPEVVGDAGIYFDPTEVGSISEAIQSVLNDQGYRNLLAMRAAQQAALFTWDASARALLACFDELRKRGKQAIAAQPTAH